MNDETKSYFGYIFLPTPSGEKKIEGVHLFMSGDEYWIEFYHNLYGYEQYNLIRGVFTGLDYVTLLECKYRGTSSGAGGSECRLGINYIIRGAHFFDENNLYFSTLVVKMPALKRWIRKSVFKDHLILDKKMSIEYPSNINIADFDDFFVDAYFGFNQNSDAERTITLSDYIILRIKVKGENFSLWRFLKIYRSIKKFLAFIGVIDKGSDSLTLYENSFKNDGSDNLVSMKLHSKRFNFKNAGVENISRPNFDDIEEDLPLILSNWFSLNDLSDSIDLLLEKYATNSLSSEAYFLNSCFSVEIFHRRFCKNQRLPKAQFRKVKKAIIAKLQTEEERRLFFDKLEFANEPSFRERLTDLTAEFEIVYGGSEPLESFIRRIVKTRNSIVHRSSDEDVLKGLEVYYAATYLEALTKLCIFKKLGFSNDQIASMFVNTKAHTHTMLELNQQLQKGIDKG